MKNILTFVLLIGSVRAATLVGSLTGNYVTTTVYFDSDTNLYTYQYTVADNPLDGKRDLSHIELTMCDPTLGINFGSDDGHVLEYTSNGVKFDDLSPDGTFNFWFQSTNSFVESVAELKAAQVIDHDIVLTPKCIDTIPEPSSSMIFLGSIGILAILRKRW